MLDDALRLDKDQEQMQRYFGIDPRVVDAEIRVQNLKSDAVMVQQRIFKDKPEEKQLDMTFEKRQRLTNLHGIVVNRSKQNFDNMRAGASSFQDSALERRDSLDPEIANQNLDKRNED